jgi:hypothetical protein
MSAEEENDVPQAVPPLVDDWLRSAWRGSSGAGTPRQERLDRSIKIPKGEVFIKLPVKDACFIWAVLEEADPKQEHALVQDAIRRIERLLPETNNQVQDAIRGIERLLAESGAVAASPSRGERVSQQEPEITR